MKITAEEVKRYRSMAEEWLKNNLGIPREHILEGRDAWTIAHKCGITFLAYQNRSVTDAHIQTALEAIFPNAIFKERKRY
jgi:hypothetical protein